MSELPDYDLSDLSGSHIEQLGQFDSILDATANKGLVSKVPQNEAETFDIVSQRSRLQTIATRLYLLGYLRNKIRAKKIHKRVEKIKKAVLKFQRDANLVQDSWVGEKTWFALDELVSFESELTVEKWFKDGLIRPEVTKAVHRAIQLRLWSLGLFDGEKPKLKSKLLNEKNLFKFGRILKIFLIKNESFKVGFNYETLSLLFDQDSLTQAITKCSKPASDSFFIKLKEGKKEIEEEYAQSFIINCTKIELWLLGYDIIIDGASDYRYKNGSNLWKQIYKFYEQFGGISTVRAKKLALQITPTLFLKIGEAYTAPDTYKKDDASEEIAKFMESSNPTTTNNRIKEAWGYIKEKGVKLWDGLKRIWRWIKKIGKKAISFIKNNIFIGFYRFTSKAYKIFSKGVSTIVKSIGVYIKGALYSPGMAFGFAKDMDTYSFISVPIDSNNAIAGILKLQKQSKAFNLGCKIIGFLFFVFKNLTLGILGWAKILLSLLKGYKDIKNFYLELKMII